MKPSHKALVALAAATLLAGALASVHDTRAQQPAAPAAQTPAEQEALELLEREQMVSARTKAEEIVAQNPRSLVGHYVLGVVLHQAEGSLARAMFHLGKAREIYETTYPASTRPAGAPYELHRDLLYRVQSLAGELELHEYRLQVLGYHDYLYDPDLLAQHAWPLMHLERYDEARDFATRAIESSDDWQKSSGLNALCALEGEAGRRQPYYDACRAALEEAQRRGADEDGQGAIAVHAYNTALAARAVLDFEEAERMLLEGARRLEFTPANPWRLLVRQHIEQGRMTDAVGALREMQRWRARQPAYLRDQDRAETDAAFAELMLIAGETEIGLRAVDRAIAQPDRRGLISSDPEQALGAHALLRRSLQRTHAEKLAEEASWSGTLARLGGAFDAMGARLESWPDDERITGVLSDDDRLIATLRLHVRGGIEPVPAWLVGDVVEVLGPGIAAVALRRARAMEEPTTPLAPFYDALEAEVALAQGEELRAWNLATSALSRLPESQSLFRARVAAIGAEAAAETGRNRDALALYEQAMQSDGGVFRRLGLRIPATVRAQGGGDVGERAADFLESSPRFRSDPGFEVIVRGAGTAVEACMRSAHGAELGCASVDPATLEQEWQTAHAAWEEEVDKAREAGDDLEPLLEKEPERPDPAEVLAERFHDRVFSAPVTLSSADLSSLDGRTTTGAEVAREQFRNLLEQTIQPPPAP